MNSFRLLTQQISRWWHMGLSNGSKKRLNYTLRRVVRRAKRYGKAAQTSKSWKTLFKLDELAKIILCPQLSRRKPANLSQRPLILVLAIVSLTSAIGYRFYNEPQLAVDTVAPQTLRAPDSVRVEDAKTTAENREAARTGLTPMLMVDQTVNQEIYQSLQRLLEEGNSLRQQAGAFPFVEPSVLSTATQQYLRQASDTDWQTAIASAETNRPVTLPRPATNPAQSSSTANAPSSSQQLAIIELQNYRRTASAEDLAVLKQVITRARQRYAVAIALLSDAADEPGSFYDATLLTLTNDEWATTRSGIREALERILLQGVAPGLPDALLETAISVQLTDEVPPPGLPLAVKMLMTITQPNLTQDILQTRLRAEQAAREVEPQFVEIRRGEIIVQAGETITQSDFVLLDHFGMSRRGINVPGLMGFAISVGGAVAIFLLVERRFHSGLRQRDYILVLLLTLTTPLVLALDVPTTTLPLVGLLTGSFYGSTLGATVVSLIGIALPLGMDVGWNQLIASAIAGLLGAAMAGRLRSREELAMLGGGVGLTQGVVYLILSLIFNTAANPVWYAVLTASAVQGLLGVACSIIALGLSPYLENLFDLITPIRLAELSNPNRPLLKRLASETPGTFQHTLFVASLAEAAARSLGCNVELVRAGTLYHDIGKMHDPMGFIENQMGKPNKHDLINDPWKSCNIIKKHVSEGLVMARKYRLPKAIQAFIPEHQGTMLIAYFYHEAQQRAQGNPKLTVKEATFRYDGPIPQTRETGIVMLADSCEAALRSLKDATPEEALAMVNRILRARWQDNQLDESGLTRAEMTRIAQIFVRVWQQVNHQRIAYPKLASTPQTPIGS